MSPKRFDTADDEGINPALVPHTDGLIVGSPAVPAPAPEAVARPAMTRRSWYLKTTVADAFQAAVDDIHHSTRVPKHEVVAALLEAAAGQRERVERSLVKSHVSHG
ncbi:hypothetical protein [Streptomyces zaomyceticus]|uniref:hypothetical protein n=1 Tax=Streptomyces zaomyceticus TaxID=68286 RepID=UPI00378D27DD